jgi:hypothetical protein
VDRPRRPEFVQLCVTVAVAAASVSAAWVLPDGGLSGLLADVLGTLGVVTALGIPFCVWAAVSPRAAGRGTAHPARRPVPVVVPVFWWVLVGGGAWCLAHVERPTPSADHAAMALLWCVEAAGLAFALAFSVMHLRDRRRAAG